MTGSKLAIVIILILAGFLRVYGLLWDQGHHLHPDERMITMVTERIHLPKPLTLNTILTPESPLNPKFFAYGSFPIYFLRASGYFFSFFNPIFGHYQGLNLVGRLFSVIFELLTIIIIFKISKKLFLQNFSYFPPLFYALSVLAIQTAHFYVVDVPLTFFTILTLYFLIRLFIKPSLKNAIFTGIALGFSLASKVSSVLLMVPVLVALALIFFKQRSLGRVCQFLLIILIFSFLIFSLTMPYALLDFKTFRAHTLEQSKMTKDAFVFPYTLQYVGSTPYLYHLKNLVFWGMGIPLGIISVVGSVVVSWSVLKRLIQWLYGYIATWLKRKKSHKSFVPSLRPTPEESEPTPALPAGRSREELRLTIQPFSHLTILLSFFWVYFLVTGQFAVKFMRYWLPIYPLFCIFGGLFLSQIALFIQAKISNIKYPAKGETRQGRQKAKIHIKKRKFLTFNLYFLFFIFYFLFFFWPLSFISIYSRTHTRITASEWIYKHIPPNATIALEHWDDGLPLHLPNYPPPQYTVLELPLYDADTDEKWEKINARLSQTDYIIIASNRLYVPLMKLTNCEKLPPHRCYPKTAKYYQKLFNGSLGFTKAAEFSSYPTLDFGLWTLDFRDDGADESFTVYDHPKVIIFKKQ